MLAVAAATPPLRNALRPMTVSVSSATHSSRVVAGVPDERDPPAGPQHPGDLGERDRVVEPVERLRARDDVGGAVRQRDRLGAAATAVAPGTAARSCSSISASGSTAVTRCPSATSERVSLPVPAPRSTTSHGVVAREPADSVVRDTRAVRARTASATAAERRGSLEPVVALRVHPRAYPRRGASHSAPRVAVALVALRGRRLRRRRERRSDELAYDEARRSTSHGARSRPATGSSWRTSRTRAATTGSRAYLVSPPRTSGEAAGGRVPPRRGRRPRRSSSARR